jgi:hypothetical protein
MIFTVSGFLTGIFSKTGIHQPTLHRYEYQGCQCIIPAIHAFFNFKQVDGLIFFHFPVDWIF